MKTRPLGRTGLDLTIVSFGASSMGAEFRSVDLNEALKSVRTALDRGMNFVDTSPFYGRGMSEVLLGIALEGVPRDSYYLGTKLGRYDKAHFDFSPKRVVESIDVSLHRMRTDYLDICLCHDIEFDDVQYVIDETIPALRKAQEQGKVRFIGISGYPMKNFTEVLAGTDLDVVLSYNHYTLQNTMFADLVPMLQEKGVGIMNAAPFSARLLTSAALPPWHKAPPRVREIAKQASDFCAANGTDIAKLALQFSIDHEAMATCITGSANPDRVSQWVDWAEEEPDREMFARVQEILAPIHNWCYIEGRPENNDPNAEDCG